MAWLEYTINMYSSMKEIRKYLQVFKSYVFNKIKTGSWKIKIVTSEHPKWKIMRVWVCMLIQACIMNLEHYIIGIKHDFPCINICQDQREVIKNEVEDRGF